MLAMIDAAEVCMARSVPDLIHQAAPYLESAWRVAHKRYPKKVGPAGKVADVRRPA
jgi:hypothetical protein